MGPSLEAMIAGDFRGLLADRKIGDMLPESNQFRKVLAGFERLVPEFLAEIYPFWRGESLDGIFPSIARKTGEGEIEILGLCIIISDQTLTPIHLRLQIAQSTDEFSWLECKLGERTRQGLQRMPYASTPIETRAYAVAQRADQIDWFYKVTFGERRP
jgi:hypothetical protein